MNLNLIHPEMNICSYGDCTTAFCVIVIGGDIYCKRHAIDALCGVELAALRARVGELEQERDELNKIIPFVLRHYDDIDDEFTESFYVNADYKIVDPSKTDEWKYLLTLKQIANRRLEKLSAALAKGAK